MPTGPEVFVKSTDGAAGPIKHKWSSALADKFHEGKDENVRLFDAMNAMSYKARMALATAVAEWILWRFEGLAEFEAGHQAVEACWAAVIHPAYCKPLGFTPKEEPVFSKVPEIDGPLKIGLSQLRETRGRYAKGNAYLAASIVRLALLAQHVIPAKAEFEAWLKSTLQRATKAFPAPKSVPETEDPTAGTPVARDFFFEPDFKLTKESNRKALEAFLERLDPKKNPFLRTPAEMKKEGFTGTPYEFSN